MKLLRGALVITIHLFRLYCYSFVCFVFVFTSWFTCFAAAEESCASKSLAQGQTIVALTQKKQQLEGNIVMYEATLFVLSLGAFFYMAFRLSNLHSDKTVGSLGKKKKRGKNDNTSVKPQKNIAATATRGTQTVEQLKDQQIDKVCDIIETVYANFLGKKEAKRKKKASVRTTKTTGFFKKAIDSHKVQLHAAGVMENSLVAAKNHRSKLNKRQSKAKMKLSVRLASRSKSKSNLAFLFKKKDDTLNPSTSSSSASVVADEFTLEPHIKVETEAEMKTEAKVKTKDKVEEIRLCTMAMVQTPKMLMGLFERLNKKTDGSGDVISRDNFRKLVCAAVVKDVGVAKGREMMGKKLLTKLWKAAKGGNTVGNTITREEMLAWFRWCSSSSEIEI